MSDYVDGPARTDAPASRVRAVLFDLDGTLVDTIGLILESFRYATTQVLGAPVNEDVFLGDIGTPLAKQMAKIAPDHAEELVRVYREHNAIHHDTLAAGYPGTQEALAALSAAGFPIGVVTSKMAAGARRGLDLFGLSKYVDVLVGSDDVPVHKPDPYPLHHAAEVLGIPLAECAYVGDSTHDMMAAKAGGAVSIAALWGPFDRADLLALEPDYAFESILEIPALLEAHHARPKG